MLRSLHNSSTQTSSGESADFCLYLCHARIVSVIELQCVRDFSTSSYWWLFFCSCFTNSERMFVSVQKSQRCFCSWNILCAALHGLLPWQLPASHQHLQHQSSTGFCQGHQRDASWEAEEDTRTEQGGRRVHHYHPPPHSLTQTPSAHAPSLFVN